MAELVPLPKLKCKRCGHEWVPRKDRVFLCPRCKSPKWDIPKKDTGQPGNLEEVGDEVVE